MEILNSFFRFSFFFNGFPLSYFNQIAFLVFQWQHVVLLIRVSEKTPKNITVCRNSLKDFFSFFKIEILHGIFFTVIIMSNVVLQEGTL